MIETALAEWADFDVAEHALGVAIGVFPPGSCMSDFKGVFWSNNPLGNALALSLRSLAGAGILEYDPEEGRYRWNASAAAQVRPRRAISPSRDATPT